MAFAEKSYTNDSTTIITVKPEALHWFSCDWSKALFIKMDYESQQQSQT